MDLIYPLPTPKEQQYTETGTQNWKMKKKNGTHQRTTSFSLFFFLGCTGKSLDTSVVIRRRMTGAIHMRKYTPPHKTVPPL